MSGITKELSLPEPVELTNAELDAVTGGDRDGINNAYSRPPGNTAISSIDGAVFSTAGISWLPKDGTQRGIVYPGWGTSTAPGQQ
jgi:hypothetical protein